MSAINFGVPNQSLKSDTKTTETKTEQKPSSPEHIIFVSDFAMPSFLKKLCQSWATPFSEFDQEIFNNVSCADLQTKLNLVWLNISDGKALKFFSSIVTDHHPYNLIAIYKTKSKHNEWLNEIADDVDNSLSKSVLESIKSLSLDELINKLKNVRKIPHVKGCFKRFLLFLFKKFNVSDD